MTQIISFQTAEPLLRKLWPHLEVIDPIDNTAGLISYPGQDYHKISLQVLGFFEGEELVATTHFYNTSPAALRMRGTYCEPAYRSRGIGRRLFNKGRELFQNIDCIYTFARKSSESFYAKLGFERVERWRCRHLLDEEYALMVRGSKYELPCFEKRKKNG